MTPIWRAEMRKALGRPHHPATIEMANARTFDLRPVEGLIDATAINMCDLSAVTRGTGDIRGVLSIDLGERVCVPAPSSWLETKDGVYWIREMPGREGDVTGSHMSKVTVCMEGKFLEIGGFVLANGKAVVVPKDYDKTTILDKESPITRGLFSVLAALAVINSPVAERSAIPGHRGLERDMRRLNPARLSRGIVHTRVVIRFGGGGGIGASHQSHPKAYHFCRAHTRQKANGRVERVRAHWRGDPAFGYRLPSYTVRPADQEAGKAA